VKTRSGFLKDVVPCLAVWQKHAIFRDTVELIGTGVYTLTDDGKKALDDYHAINRNHKNPVHLNAKI
jgi:hypothetical protein